MDSNLLVMLVSGSVPDIKSGLVSGRISQNMSGPVSGRFFDEIRPDNYFSIFRFYCHRHLSTIVQNFRQFDFEEKCLSFKHSMP